MRAMTSMWTVSFVSAGANAWSGSAMRPTSVTPAIFNPAINNMVAALEKAIGGGRSVQVIDSSSDDNRLLVWAGSDTDPGQYYLFDKTAKTLAPVIAERPQLAGVTLAQVRAIRYPAADGTMIPAYLTRRPARMPGPCRRSSCPMAHRPVTSGASIGCPSISSLAVLP